MGNIKENTSFHLKDFHCYNTIIVQCHDNPDADTLSCGYGIYTYFKSLDKDVRLIYSGKFEINKPNLTLMIKTLNIPIEYVTELPPPELLITVDSQVGGGNVTPFQAAHYAEIDHHIGTDKKDFPSIIRPELSSCATLVWDLLRTASFDPNNYPHLATALYYGLYTDTNFLAEVRHPLDKDMIDALKINSRYIRLFKDSNLTMSDLEVAGIALLRCSTNKTHHFGVLEAKPCDPNILGFINDLAIQVDRLHVSVVYFESKQGAKFSVRSCTPEVKANDFAAYLTEGIGSGGGHVDKAGGFINFSLYSKKYPSTNIETYFHNIIRKYFESFDIIYAKDTTVDISNMETYSKKPIIIGYTPSTRIYELGTPVRIRTLEGDIDIVASEDIYILVNIEGEVQPIQREKFDRTYKDTEKDFDITYTYTPTARNKLTGEIVDLMAYIDPCVATGESKIYAKPLERNVKVFTLWSDEQYFTGLVGDYLAVRHDDPHDIYIIQQDIFAKTYGN